MDFSNPWLMLSGLLIGGIGFIMFLFGKREANLRVLSAGLFLCVMPYFAHSVLLLWGLTGACLGALYGLDRWS